MMQRMIGMICASIIVWTALVSAIWADDPTPLPRVVYALYDPASEEIPRFSLVHRVLEMPLNWLGFHMEYIDITDAFPAWRDDVAGVVLWLPSGVMVKNVERYMEWLEAGASKQKKLLIMGNPGINTRWRDMAHGRARVNRLFSYIGMHDTGNWTELTYSTTIAKQNDLMVEFERSYDGVLPAYYNMQALPEASIHLAMNSRNELGTTLRSDLVTTHENGGYIAEGYGFYYEMDAQDEEVLLQRWLVDPFRFLSRALGADDRPRPDVTTLNGHRIFYSHMDGDGWNNVSEIEKYAAKRVITAEVLRREIYRPYHQLPFTVAPIVADLDAECYGLPHSADVARDIFALENIEPASHTYSHPLFWRYFDHAHPRDEVQYLDDYPAPPKQQKSIYNALGQVFGHAAPLREGWKPLLESSITIEDTPYDAIVKKYYKRPRSYSCDPFDLSLEIGGSVRYLQDLAPVDKRIRLIQWSGDTNPAESALREARQTKLLNINGGDSRFDPAYPSYSYVAPIGLKVGKERQVYSSNSNENTYTDLWRKQFFGYRHLVNTVKNTETPRRVSPFNIYYHSYSAEKQTSLSALRQNLSYALSQDITPVFASHYVDIANGFFQAQLIYLEKDRWQIAHRGQLQTIRFDRATLKTVDWERSEGVLGMKHYQGSLYVFLNPSVDTPIIALSDMQRLTYPLKARHPYLIGSRWVVRAMTFHERSVNGGQMQMIMQGFGRGVMQFYWPLSKKVQMHVIQDGKTLHNEVLTVKDNNMLKFVIRSSAIQPLQLVLTGVDDV